MKYFFEFLKCTYTTIVVTGVMMYGQNALAASQYKKLPDTGQSSCSDDSVTITCPNVGEPYYGQDAQYTGSPPAYHDNGNGTITDKNTGLLWQKAFNNSVVTWYQANNYCNGLSLGNREDWRLPTMFEWESIRDVTSPKRLNPIFDTHIQEPYVHRQVMYWSGTEVENGASARVFQSAGWSNEYWDKSLASCCVHVRCVSGAPLRQGTFRSNYNNTVSDTTYGLMWQKNDLPPSFPRKGWQHALAYCETLTVGGYTDWRLPNTRELTTIIDFNKTSQTLNPVFTISGNDEKVYYWSNTSTIGSGEVFGISASYGGVAGFPKTGVVYEESALFSSVQYAYDLNIHTRCVRDITSQGPGSGNNNSSSILFMIPRNMQQRK